MARFIGVKTVQGRANAGAVIGPEEIVRMIAGSNISIGLVQAGGELQFTIDGSAGFPGYGGTPPADAGAGSGGASPAVSRADHSHPLSGSYATAAQAGLNIAHNGWQNIANTITFNPGFTPDVAFWPGQTGGGGGTSNGVANGTAAGQQHCHMSAGPVVINNTVAGDGGFGNRWRCTSFTSSNITWQQVIGSQNYSGLIIVIGHA